MKKLNKYLIALPALPKTKGFCCPTVLVSARDESDAYDLAKHLRPGKNIGDIKQVYY